ncbi:MAG: tRNA preQ1(34) S-adenosylmethionine ribosyltransferase-isomerase QueA [Candidatus Cloacimonetes bacterium]|nr:tRNA preQ1(34) S-adenosylmethionine ribosyltransferase-isomerase QueA [Candidatus Cloacimonadota bacterium]
MDLTNKSSYYYNLPKELIAQFPEDIRTNSRLLSLNKSTGEITHQNFHNIGSLLRDDDVLVLNNTKVILARLFGHKTTGAKVEVFLLNQLTPNRWECLVKPGSKLQIGAEIIFNEQLSVKIIDFSQGGSRIVEFYFEGDFWEILEIIGNMPLPPYIKRDSEEKDKTTYQTVYAKERGSVAAPTAGLHFTNDLITKLQKRGITFLEVILHVGLGTFRPVKSEKIIDHKMHSEHCQISQKTADFINKAKFEKRRIIAVGTTTTRTLESFAENNIIKAGSHWTDIFIYPGKELQIIDGLITNFHMPESTLLMLISAFAGYENAMRAYKIAVEEKYRFFSYGDSMLIL